MEIVRGSSATGSVIGAGSGTGAGAGAATGGGDVGDDAVTGMTSGTVSTRGMCMRGGGEVCLEALNAFLLLYQRMEFRDILR